MKKCNLIILAFCLCSAGLHAQDFKQRQQSQERSIKAAQRRHRITGKEYAKLMQEQRIIAETIDKAAADSIWTAHEKNLVAGKLERAGNACAGTGRTMKCIRLFAMGGACHR